MFPKVYVTITETSRCLSSGTTVVGWSQFQNFVTNTENPRLPIAQIREERGSEKRKEHNKVLRKEKNYASSLRYSMNSIEIPLSSFQPRNHQDF